MSPLVERHRLAWPGCRSRCPARSGSSRRSACRPRSGADSPGCRRRSRTSSGGGSTARSLKSGVLIHRDSENGSKRSKLPRGSVTLFSPLSRSALPTRPSTSSGPSDVWPGFLGSARLATLPPSMASSGKSPISPVSGRLALRRLRARPRKPAGAARPGDRARPRRP